MTDHDHDLSENILRIQFFTFSLKVYDTAEIIVNIVNVKST